MVDICHPYKRLTDKQRLFIDKYIHCLNATQAAKQAGYQGNNINRTASQLLRNPKVREVIEDKLRLGGAEEGITPEVVKNGIRKTIEEAKSSKDKLYGWELLGKILKMFEPTQQQGDITLISLINNHHKSNDPKSLSDAASYNGTYVKSLVDEKPSATEAELVEDKGVGGVKSSQDPANPPGGGEDIIQAPPKNSQQNSIVSDESPKNSHQISSGEEPPVSDDTTLTETQEADS